MLRCDSRRGSLNDRVRETRFSSRQFTVNGRVASTEDRTRVCAWTHEQRIGLSERREEKNQEEHDDSSKADRFNLAVSALLT